MTPALTPASADETPAGKANDPAGAAGSRDQASPGGETLQGHSIAASRYLNFKKRGDCPTGERAVRQSPKCISGSVERIDGRNVLVVGKTRWAMRFCCLDQLVGTRFTKSDLNRKLSAGDTIPRTKGSDHFALASSVFADSLAQTNCDNGWEGQTLDYPSIEPGYELDLPWG